VSAPLLQVSHVTARYGVLPVLHDVSLDIHQREIVALIGANGAGKTTLMMTVFGRPRPSHGRILFAGRNITELPAHAIARLGIAQSPEGRRIFPRMTVMENLQMGAIIANAEVFEQDLDRVCALFPVLKARRDQRGGTLSGGEQQMLAIARALMGRPKLLLLDEPSLGLAPLIVKQIFEVIKELNSKHGLPVFIVEQNAYHALKLAHRGYVMVNGRITLSGSGAELLSSEEVQTAYLDGGRRKETQGARP
jgi:branched-chain amino acid transport system ATP-binding protein